MQFKKKTSSNIKQINNSHDQLIIIISAACFLSVIWIFIEICRNVIEKTHSAVHEHEMFCCKQIVIDCNKENCHFF